MTKFNLGALPSVPDERDYSSGSATAHAANGSYGVAVGFCV
jgi:hypothetical protein